MTLGGQVVDLLGPYPFDNADQTGGIGQVTVVQKEIDVLLVHIPNQMVDSAGIEHRSAASHPVHFVSLFQQQLRKVGAVLAGDTGDQCFLFHFCLDYSLVMHATM